MSKSPDLIAKFRKRSSLASVGSRISSSFFGFFRNRDQYGQAISLNYKGEDTFNTSIGGLLCLLLYVFIISYGVIEFIAVVNYRDW